MTTTTTRYTMTKGLDLGPVELTVADLARSLVYYTESIGLQLLAQDSRSAQLVSPAAPWPCSGRSPVRHRHPPPVPG